MKNIYITILMIMFTICCNDANAKQKNDAEIAKIKNLAAITIFVDINFSSFKNGATRKMTNIHQQFAKEGYELTSVNIYIENGVLDGFFVSYKMVDYSY